MLRKKRIKDSIAFPTAAPARAGWGRIKTKSTKMIINIRSHRGMGSRLLPVVGQHQGGRRVSPGDGRRLAHAFHSRAAGGAYAAGGLGSGWGVGRPRPVTSAPEGSTGV